MTTLTQQTACDWTWDRQVVRNAGTNVGGPAQIGPSRQVRFHGDMAPSSVIDLIIYVTGEDAGYRLNLLAVWSVFDPATLEVTWSAARTWASPEAARELVVAGSEACCDAHDLEARDGLAGVLAVFGQDVHGAVLGWDGQPFQDGDGS